MSSITGFPSSASSDSWEVFGADQCDANALRNDQWDRIKDLLPGREGHFGVTAKDNRLFVEAVLYRYRAGIPWRDLPERFGDPIKIRTRFSRWAKRDIFLPHR
jgi:transposase